MKKRRIIVKARRSRLLGNILKMFFIMTSKIPRLNNVIVFESFLGKQYSDNPKAIYLYMKSNYPQYKLYWSVDKRYKNKFENEGLNILPRFSVKWMLKMARAKYWITNSRLPLWMPKPQGTIYIQTWHGTPLKRLAKDIEEVHMPGVSTKKYKEDFKMEAKKWNVLISPNPYSTKIFKKAFDFKGEIIESGYPRNDLLYTNNNKKNINEIKLKLNIPRNKKVILYAPTWRDDEYSQVGKYKFDLRLDLDLLKRKFGNDFIVILIMHYLVAENLNLSAHEGFAFDFSMHNDINDLYLISDVLITDYSSVFFDYANLRKPILFFVYDIDSYRDKLRGFYFNIENEAPGPLTKTTEEIVYYLNS